METSRESELVGQTSIEEMLDEPVGAAQSSWSYPSTSSFPQGRSGDFPDTEHFGKHASSMSCSRTGKVKYFPLVRGHRERG